MKYSHILKTILLSVCFSYLLFTVNTYAKQEFDWVEYDDPSETIYDVSSTCEYDEGEDKTTFTYTVVIEDVPQAGISHFEIEIPCEDDYTFESQSPPISEIGGPFGNSGWTGIKWEVNGGPGTYVFSFKLDGEVPCATVRVAIKQSTTFYWGYEFGPLCYDNEVPETPIGTITVLIASISALLIFGLRSSRFSFEESLKLI